MCLFAKILLKMQGLENLPDHQWTYTLGSQYTSIKFDAISPSPPIPIRASLAATKPKVIGGLKSSPYLKLNKKGILASG